jgi:hypothetical protein
MDGLAARLLAVMRVFLREVFRTFLPWTRRRAVCAPKTALAIDKRIIRTNSDRKERFDTFSVPRCCIAPIAALQPRGYL